MRNRDLEYKNLYKNSNEISLIQHFSAKYKILVRENLRYLFFGSSTDDLRYVLIFGVKYWKVKGIGRGGPGQ